MRAVAIAVLAATSAGVGPTVLRSSHHADSTAAPPADAAGTASAVSMPAPTPPAELALEQQVGELEDFVSKARDLHFFTPVRARLVDDKTFDDALGVNDVDEADRQAIETVSQVMKAVGLLGPNVDLAHDETETAKTSVVGLYRPEQKDLLVRGTSLTPFAKSVLVHELTHALDDQHFGLDRHDMANDIEQQSAFQALTEGDAVRIERAYVAQMSPADQEAVKAFTKTAIDRTKDAVDPQAAYYFDAFPYVDGPEFVEALAKRGGERAVDAAFAKPPTTTAEILVPERYETGIAGVRLSAPRTPAPAFLSGVFGALGLYLLLSSAVSPKEAAAATVSWEGDLFLAWHDAHGRTCVTMRFLLDAPWSAELTAKLFERWAAKQIDAKVDAPGTVVVTSCR